MKLKINWEHKRVKHAIERMWLRGVSAREVRETLERGKKSFQRETGLMLSIFKRLIVVYDENLQSYKHTEGIPGDRKGDLIWKG